ncbi:MAG: hypothetical protein KC925_02310 [Candidatus Doudnabacteria bacterium]|nr:hypothetical protein [Candidatus Doudnabacteria bacterium]
MRDTTTSNTRELRVPTTTLAMISHGIVKGLYLMAATLVLPVAVYVVQHEPLIAGSEGTSTFFFVSLYFLGPLFVIFFVGLGVYLFPTRFWNGLLALVSFLLPLLAVVITGRDSLLTGVYALFHASLLSLVLFWLGTLVLVLVRPSLFGIPSRSWKAFLGGLVFALVLIGFAWTASVPFFVQLAEVRSGTSLLWPFVAIVVQVLYGALTWYFTLRRRASDSGQQEVERAWDAWGNATVGALLLSVVGALAVMILGNNL